jgi:hypothetical protein
MKQADAFAGPVGHRGAGELGAVVAAQHGRIAPVDGEAVEFGRSSVVRSLPSDKVAALIAPTLQRYFMEPCEVCSATSDCHQSSWVRRLIYVRVAGDD